MYNVGSLSSLFNFENSISPPRKNRRSSVDETSQRKIFVAAMLENGQTPDEYTLPPVSSKSNVENLLQKFKDFWNRAGEILRLALDFVCDIFLKNKLHKVGSFSWNVVKIKSIFSFTWQQSSPSTTTTSAPQLHIQGNYVEHQTIIFNGPPGTVSEIAAHCIGCGHHQTIHSSMNATPLKITGTA